MMPFALHARVATGTTVIMVYQVLKRKVAVALIDEHDAAYDTLRTEKRAKRRRRR